MQVCKLPHGLPYTVRLRSKKNWLDQLGGPVKLTRKSDFREADVKVLVQSQVLSKNKWSLRGVEMHYRIKHSK